MKRIILLSIVTMFAISSNAQINIYQAPNKAAGLISQDEKSMMLLGMKNLTPTCLGDLINIHPAPYLIGDTLYSVGDTLSSFNKGSYLTCVLMLNSTHDTLRMTQIPIGEYFYVSDIIVSKKQIDSLFNVFSNTKYISDKFYDKSFIKGEYKIPLKITKDYQKVPVWQYLYGKQDSMQELLDYLNPSQKKISFGNPIYVLENKGAIYFVRQSLLARSHHNRPFIYQSLPFDQQSKRIYLTHLSAFISATTYKYLEDNYIGKEFVHAFYKNREDYLTDRIVYNLEKLYVRDGVICGQLNQGAKQYTIKIQCSKKLQIFNYDKSIVDELERIEGSSLDNRSFCIALKKDVDSLIAKWRYEEEQERLADERKQEQYRVSMVQKYGEKYGNLIAKGEICIGMTKEMCKETLGRPEQINKVTNALGEAEVWAYISNWAESVLFNSVEKEYMFVTFIDGKITSIME